MMRDNPDHPELLRTILEYYRPEPMHPTRATTAAGMLDVAAELTLRDLACYPADAAGRSGDREKLATLLGRMFRDGWTAGRHYEAEQAEVTAEPGTAEQELEAIRQRAMATLRGTLRLGVFYAEDIALAMIEACDPEMTALVAGYLQARIDQGAEAAFQLLRPRPRLQLVPSTREDPEPNIAEHIAAACELPPGWGEQ
jgi:hypothetical protein